MGDVDLDKGNPSEVLGKCQDYPVKSSLAVFWSENQVESSIGANVELEVYLVIGQSNILFMINKLQSLYCFFFFAIGQKIAMWVNFNKKKLKESAPMKKQEYSS